MSTTGRVVWKRTRTSLEHWVEGVLSRLGDEPPQPPVQAKVVVLGGGTGLSTVLGGNPADPDWAMRPVSGLIREFSQVGVGVCTTDDGGSTGELVRRLPMIGIGDLRKVMLSMIDRGRLAERYGKNAAALTVIQEVFRHRFGTRPPTSAQLADPIRVLSRPLQKVCPPALRRALARLTENMPEELEERLRLPGHSMGNLIMTAAVFRANKWRIDRHPPMTALEAGLTAVAEAIGVPPHQVHAVTAIPGTLIYDYANGVVATGQARAAKARRHSSVHRIRLAFAQKAHANAKLLARLKDADLIIYAPGSLYSSMLPVLLTPGVVEAIRSNTRAIKILGANLWIQKGETDMSFREESRGFWVSELIEAYGRNVQGGLEGLFDVVLATSLDTVPGSIIRNYAMEDKHPIHLDRRRVEALGVMPVEASLFRRTTWQRESMLHHDAARFAAAIRTIYEGLRHQSRRHPRKKNKVQPLSSPALVAGIPACARMDIMRTVLDEKDIPGKKMAKTLEDFMWENPDVRIDHLTYFKQIKLVPAARWQRTPAWKTVPGYFDPDTAAIVLHQGVAARPDLLRTGFAIALGESLLNRYISRKQWTEDPHQMCNIYEIELHPDSHREGYLNRGDLRTYLKLVKMLPVPHDPMQFWRPVPKGSGFLPCGIRFGLMFAWYLDNLYVPGIDFEMQILQWPVPDLLPAQLRARQRQRRLVEFFRQKVFKNGN